MVQQTKFSEREFVWNQTHRIPKVYKNVIEIVYQQQRGYVDYRRKYKLDCRKLLNLKYQLGIYIRYMRYYYHHKDEIDRILKKKLVSRDTEHKHKLQIFIFFLRNPLCRSDEAGQSFNLSASSFRVIVSQSWPLLESNTIIKPLLCDLDFIRFGRLRISRMREVLGDKIDENLKDALNQIDWLLPKQKPLIEVTINR